MMLTLLTYQLYTRDYDRTTARIAAEPVVKRESDYYAAHIHDVTTVHEFMGDYRLYSYAMKAYGLEDQIGSKALMKKVLESDLSDSKSLANKLSDDRYRSFAQAFSFSTASASATKPTAETTDQMDSVVEAYSEHGVRAGQAQAAATKAYLDGIGSVKNVDDFLDNPTLFKVALESVGIDASIASRSFIRNVLTGTAADGPAANGDDRYTKLAALLPFGTDGAVPAGGLQTAAEANTTAYDYLAQKGLAATPLAASYQVDYYESEIGKVTNAADFVGDPRLLDVALTSVGLNPDYETSSFVWTILTSDPADPNSALNKMKEDTEAAATRKQQYKDLLPRFHFDAQGNIPAGSKVQTDAEVEAMTGDYLDNYKTATDKSDSLAGSLYKAQVVNITTPLQFVSSAAVYAYALKAFDIDPGTASKSQIMRVLRSDPSDPKSYASRLGDERYLKLAAAFNFDDSGKLAPPRTAETEANQVNTANRYAALLGDAPTDAQTAKAKDDTAAYRTALSSVVNVDDFVSNDTITTYALKAYGLTGDKLSKDDLASILTSDLSDPKSYANQTGDRRIIEFAAAYNFRTDGGINRGTEDAQTAHSVMSTQDLYLQQTMEQEAGDENQGVRLALYFRRVAPDLKSAYDVLADPALLTVVQTAVGLPVESGQSDIDVQKRTIENKLDLASLKDPKKLDQFINRFIALYDTANTSTSSTSPALAILAG